MLIAEVPGKIALMFKAVNSRNEKEGRGACADGRRQGDQRSAVCDPGPGASPGTGASSTSLRQLVKVNVDYIFVNSGVCIFDFYNSVIILWH